jgi:hypothetical protein
MRGSKTASQRQVLFPEPLPIHQKGEALFEAELAHVGRFHLSLEGFGHSMQLHRVRLFNRRLI